MNEDDIRKLPEWREAVGKEVEPCHEGCDLCGVETEPIMALALAVAREAVQELHLRGDDVAAALVGAMEAGGLDAEAIEHCNYVIGRWADALPKQEAAR